MFSQNMVIIWYLQKKTLPNGAALQSDVSNMAKWDILTHVPTQQQRSGIQPWAKAPLKMLWDLALHTTLEECHPIMCGKRHTDPNPSCESCSGPQTTAPGLLSSGINNDLAVWDNHPQTSETLFKSRSPAEKFQHTNREKKYEFGHTGEGKWKQFDFIHNNPSPRWHSSGPREILACDSFHEGKWQPGSECLTSPTIWNSLSISLSPYPEY